MGFYQQGIMIALAMVSIMRILFNYLFCCRFKCSTVSDTDTGILCDNIMQHVVPEKAVSSLGVG